ncbi:MULTISPECIES: lasso RiPP family leader peptide-containing protein [Lysinibacillus]|uniref:lasso RiPP family leader peptide-containing protein n=1 Tax=Lysinibacillus TaxID=400634 RepID=UPI002579DCE3|nr:MULTISPECIES: lasso RiPP family leader peptide-containing protein [Lysinibacillus]
MKRYSAPIIVEFGNAAELVKGCGGWGCEIWFNNFSYRMEGGKCVDIYPGESGYC